MPVTSLKKAPIKTLLGANLTLPQVNHILRMYDALKKAKDVKNAWAVAITNFKKLYEKVEDKWKRRKEDTSAAAGACDLRDLEKYVIVEVGEHTVGSVDDLRELEAELGRGIYALWSDDRQSIIAFAFEPQMYTEEEAAEWVREAMSEPTSTAAFDFILPVIAYLVDKFAPSEEVALVSFDVMRRAVDNRLSEMYPRVEDVESAPVPTSGPWIIEMGTEVVVFEWGGQRYAAEYAVGVDERAEISTPTPVTQEWISRLDGAPVLLHAFSGVLGDGSDADDGDDDLLWKEIIHPGTWFKKDTGRVIEITKAMIEAAFAAWQAGLPKLIPVPSDSHRSGEVPPEVNRGFVQKLKLVGDRLFGGFRFTHPTITAQVVDGSDVSVFLQANVYHPETGTQYDWVLRHVLLTLDPLVTDLEPFSAVPATGDDGQGTGASVVVYESHEEVTAMAVDTQVSPDTQSPTPAPVVPEGAVVLGADDAQRWLALSGLGADAEDLAAMMEQRAQVVAQARELAVTRIVRALEGSEEIESVTQIEGTRHWPVVCAAVEEALTGQAAGLGLDAQDDGSLALDGVVLAVVNAIPAEGRMATSEDAPRAPKTRPAENTGDEAVTDDQVDEFRERVGA